MAFGSRKPAVDLHADFQATVDAFNSEVDAHAQRAADRHDVVKARRAALEAEDASLQQLRDRIAATPVA